VEKIDRENRHDAFSLHVDVEFRICRILYEKEWNGMMNGNNG
jgi:hypothetical protein